MDIVCIAIFAFYFVKGCLKGFVGMVFALLTFFFVAFLAWQLTKYVTPFVESIAGSAAFGTLSNFLNGAVPGKFSSVAEFQTALSQTKIGAVFSLFLAKVLPNLAIEGELSAGQILAPTLTAVLLKLIAFVLVFVVLEIIIRILRYLAEKFIKKCGLSFGNRILGGILGLIKGLLVFSLVFVILSAASNLLINQGLLNFVHSGKISNFIYQTFAQKIFSIFY